MADTPITLEQLEETVQELKARGYVPRMEEVLQHLRRQQDNYVRVRFTSGMGMSQSRPYTYYCPGAEVGDWVVVPPSSVRNSPALLKVREKGTGGAVGPFRPAHLVPRDIAVGADGGRAGRGELDDDGYLD